MWFNKYFSISPNLLIHTLLPVLQVLVSVMVYNSFEIWGNPKATTYLLRLSLQYTIYTHVISLLEWHSILSYVYMYDTGVDPALKCDSVPNNYVDMMVHVGGSGMRTPQETFHFWPLNRPIWCNLEVNLHFGTLTRRYNEKNISLWLFVVSSIQ